MIRIIILSFSLLLSSCLKLDNNLYNVSDKITEYKLDNYTGEQDFILDASYNIAATHINLFPLTSKSEDGKDVEIFAIYLGDISRINTDTVILYCHGNKWHMDFYWQRAKLLAHLNGKNRYGVLMMDYQGYGLSGGEPHEQGMYNDVQTCIDWLKSKGLTGERLMMYGFSLGSASACELTANPVSLAPSKLILEAPFASAAVMVQDASQLNMPGEYFTNLKIDNAEEIKKVNQPLFWIHGDNDNFLSYKTHGEVVFKYHPGVYKENHLIAGADHGEVPEKAGFENYLTMIGEFIRK
jgi:pimeloyl-ACP methyl ester carboxylesterase